MQIQSHELSFDCVLPSAIFYNKKLEPAAIRAYAIIRNLTRIHGFCFATNEYLAQILEADVSSIKRWIRSLAKEGYLKIETDKNGIHWQRRIYLADKFKKCLRRLKIAPPPAQNCTPPSSKMSHINKEESKEEEKKEIPPILPLKGENKAREMCEFLHKKILESKPNFSKTPTKKWEQDFEALLKVRSMEDLKNLIIWALSDSFWKTNVFSPGALLKNLDKIEARITQEKENQWKNQKYPTKSKDFKPTFSDKSTREQISPPQGLIMKMLENSATG